MGELYSLIAEAIGEEDDPRVATKRVFEVLRDEAHNLPVAGVTSNQVSAVCNALLQTIEASDLVDAEAEARVRIGEWPAFKAEIEALGCDVTLLDAATSLWEISGPGTQVELNLGSGAIGGFCETEHLASLGQLAKSIRSEVERKAKHQADEARKREKRLTHQWDNKRKSWVPHN